MLDVGSKSFVIFRSSLDVMPWRHVCTVETVHRAINCYASPESSYHDIESSEPSLLDSIKCEDGLEEVFRRWTRCAGLNHRHPNHATKNFLFSRCTSSIFVLNHLRVIRLSGCPVAHVLCTRLERDLICLGCPGQLLTVALFSRQLLRGNPQITAHHSSPTSGFFLIS